MTKKLLIVGPMAEGFIEVFETAEALGFQPISVHTSGDLSEGRWPAFMVQDVPPELWEGPVFVGSGNSNETARGMRLDHYWQRQFVEGLEVARAHGAKNFLSLIHPTAHLSPSAEVGNGVFIGPGVTVANSTTIGDFSRIGRGSTVGHHVRLGRNVRLGPGVTIPGQVELADEVTVGPGVTFINGIIVGKQAFIGAGSVVTRRVFEGTLVVGNPARPQRNLLKLFRKKVRRYRARLLRKIGLYEVVQRLHRRLRP